MNDNDLKKLSLILSIQLELQNELLSLEQSKTKVLTDGDISKLEEIMKQEQSFVCKCDDQQKKYQTFLSETNHSNITLKQLVREYDADNKFQLQTLLNSLEDMFGRLKKVNNVNTKILQSRLSVIGNCLSFIGIKDAVTYNKDGRF